MENYGLLTRPIDPKDWIYKEYSPLGSAPINESGNWTSFLPVAEKQNLGGFDRMACVTYSFLNCLEILWKFKNQERNFSDRFLAKASGTTHSGNYLDQVWRTARNIGLVNESDYPDGTTSWNDYYKELTEDLITLANSFLKDYEVLVEHVMPNDRQAMMDALKESPLQVTVAFASGVGNLNPKGGHNHAVTIYNFKENEYWEIFDHYNQVTKRYAWKYIFGVVAKFTLNKKNNNPIPMKVENNTMYNLVEGGGAQAIGLDGRLIIDEAGKILATWFARNTVNGMFTGGKVVSVRLEDWNSVPHVNLDGDPV